MANLANSRIMTRLWTDDNIEKILANSDLSDNDDFQDPIKRVRKKKVYVWASYLLLFCSHLAVFLAGSIWAESKILRECFDRTTIWSMVKSQTELCHDLTQSAPMKPKLSPKTKFVRYNGTLDWESPYHGRPSPEIDAAWEKIQKISYVSLSAEDVISIGSSLDAVKLPEAYGGGYLGHIDLQHKLHCVNLLRKSLFINYDYYKATDVSLSDPPEIQRHHLEHCLEMVRQDLMCHADPAVFTSFWVDNYPRPYPNFNEWKVCRNGEEVLEWAREHAIRDIENWDDIRLENSISWPGPPQPANFTAFPALSLLHL